MKNKYWLIVGTLFLIVLILLVWVGADFASGKIVDNREKIAPRQTEKIVYGTVIFGGDVMLGRAVNALQIKENNFDLVWENIAPLLQDTDLAVVNLETPLTENCPTVAVGMIFCAGARAVSGLKNAGVDVVNLANNHTRNYGGNGLLETKNVLAKNGIAFIGETGDGYGNLVMKNIGGVKIGILGFDDVTQKLDAEKVAAQVASAREQVDTLITTFHFGVEYVARANQRQITLAHLAVGNGADLVIGHHPHWVQNSEIYNDKIIYYSLGNLIFDQMWSEETRRGLVVKLQFKAEKNKNGYDVTWQTAQEIPVKINGQYQPIWLLGK
jgi:poly-gamma-glutamate synthesis protein (capsule biosynthesis protein)